ncbi:SusC/RagA family TonB-linked outer membrane protein [Sphingobacterium spiritivorum]|uniref:SusC/RagA family TonB-linked outer membrane protein n=1 Tax=Sphingobacterium spiritivorum TaxID=258 RepID=UPI003DA23961
MTRKKYLKNEMSSTLRNRQFESGRKIVTSIMTSLWKSYTVKKFTLSAFLSFLLILSVTASKASTSYQTKETIHGIVKDSRGNPLQGASVLILQLKKTTSTNKKGEFIFEDIPHGMYTLQVSYIGYTPTHTDITIKANNPKFSITLQADETGLNEVIVVGYGTQKRSDLTGSIAKASVEDMQKAPVGNFTDALAGRVAGVVVSAPGGQPGSTPNIVIRGNNSISQSNSPLWVVDGFPMEDANVTSINPNDIESVEVLKDASATAIYGARGANGVIIVTTKKGKSGPPVVTLNGSYGWQKIGKTMKLMSPEDFINYQSERDILSNTLYRNPVSGLLGPGTVTDSIYFRNATIEDYRNIEGTDFQQRMFLNSPMQNYDISIRGGSDKTKYALSGSIFDQDGVLINSGFRRYQGRINLEQVISRIFKIGADVNYSNQKGWGSSPVPANISGYFTAQMSPFYTMWGYRPVSPLNENGSQTVDLETDFLDPAQWNTNSIANQYIINPLINQQHRVRDNITNSLNANAYTDINILKDLKLRITGGINQWARKEIQFNDAQTAEGSPLTANGSTYGVNGSVTNTQYTGWSNENILTWNKSFVKKHNLTMTGVISEQGGLYTLDGASAVKLPKPELGIAGLSQGTPQNVISSKSNWTLASFMARANYNYESKYFLTLSYRADGSSKFGPDNKWGNFWSGAVKWNFFNESFLKDTQWISNGALRASYGQTGNNRVSDFATYSRMGILTPVVAHSSDGAVFANEVPPFAYPSSFGNPQLRWETTEQTNIGLDLGAFKGHIALTIDVYRKKTKDLLLNAAVPLVQGYRSVFKNIGSMQNQGLEIALNTTNIKTADFSWTSNFNISWNQSKILSLAQNQESIPSNTGFDGQFSNTPSYISKIGQPIGQMYGLVWEGVYQYEDFNYTTALNTSAGFPGSGSHWVLKDNIPTNGNNRASIQPGDIKYKDLNGDGVVDAEDYTVIGRGLPIHTGGFGNNFSYKDFDLNLFFQWSYGNNIQNANRIIFEGNNNNTPQFNQFESYNNRWTPENTNTKLFRTGGAGPSGRYSSRTIEDGSYLRLKTVSIGYNLPAKITNKMKIQKLRINFSGQNLLTLTGYSGLDPEISTYNSVLTPGFDWSGYPQSRTFTLGLNATF